jgi:methionyl-tRNA formyltransferase
MKVIGAKLLVKTIKELAEGSLKETPQQTLRSTQHKPLQHAPKIFTDTCKIDWNKTVTEIYNLIRGLSPSPAAFTFLNEKKLKIYKAAGIQHLTPPDHTKLPGRVETDHKTYLRFAAADGFISILELQSEGKKKMEIEDFLRGYRV